MKLETFVRRHEFCITMTDLSELRQRARDKGTYWPTKGVTPVCNHPQDGYCIDELKLAIKDGKVGVSSSNAPWHEEDPNE